jgi:hypothetical protein
MLKYVPSFLGGSFCYFFLISGLYADCSLEAYKKMEEAYKRLAHKLEEEYRNKKIPQEAYNYYRGTLDIVEFGLLPSYHTGVGSPDVDREECDLMENAYNDMLTGIEQRMADPTQNVG